MSYTVGFELKAIELAEATSNRNAGGMCRIGRRKRRN